MLYISGECPVCRGGTVGFRKCSNGRTIVMMCDECDAVWLRPDLIAPEAAIYPSSPTFVIEGLGCSIAKSSDSRWATRKEVHDAGFEKFVAGEGQAFDE